MRKTIHCFPWPSTDGMVRGYRGPGTLKEDRSVGHDLAPATYRTLHPHNYTRTLTRTHPHFRLNLPNMNRIESLSGEFSFDPTTGILKIPTNVKLYSADCTSRRIHMRHHEQFYISKAISDHYATQPQAKFQSEAEILRSAREIVTKVLAELPIDEDPSAGSAWLYLTLQVSGLSSTYQEFEEAEKQAYKSSEASELAFDAIISAVAEQLSAASRDHPPEMVSRFGASVSSIESKVFDSIAKWLLEDPSDVPVPET